MLLFLFKAKFLSQKEVSNSKLVNLECSESKFLIFRDVLIRRQLGTVGKGLVEAGWGGEALPAALKPH